MSVAVLKCMVRHSGVNQTLGSGYCRKYIGYGFKGMEGILEPAKKVAKTFVNGVHDHSNSQSEETTLKVKRLSENAIMPTRGSCLAAGLDLYSAKDVMVPAMGKVIIPTDLSIALPPFSYGRIAPRSGLAWKYHLDVGAGVIDEDYRGPVGVVMFNLGQSDYQVKAGDRVAQLVVEQILRPKVEDVSELDNTERGDGGYGSTGKN